MGDWWNVCQWGDGKAACERLGVNYENARVCGHVSEQIRLLRRRNNLSFSHHREVCPIDDKTMQDKFLDWAEKEKATVEAFRYQLGSISFTPRTEVSCIFVYEGWFMSGFCSVMAGDSMGRSQGTAQLV